MVVFADWLNSPTRGLSFFGEGGRKMSRTLFARSLVALLLAVMLGVSAATPALAYGPENWQIGFAGTGVFPSTGFGFGFWGWCAFGGGVASGNTGDCQFAQYFHAPSGGGFTCQESLDITSWSGSGGTFVIIAATATVNPTSLTAPCLEFFPGRLGFPVDTGFPAAPGHFNVGNVLGVRGEFQIQVTQLP
jgi:hypothetical protein